MTGSMYAAVSGLKAHMNALNVIGNNVSNVNTTGYKATRYTFNEALYTTQRSGSDGTAVSGGRNPAQVGFGGSIGTIDLDMSTKNYTPTGQLLDTMIDGDGFFFVGDKELGDGATAVSVTDQAALAGMKLTRLGNFNIDPNGYLVDGNGSVVWGFLETDRDITVTVNSETGEKTESTTKLADFKYDLTTGKRVADDTAETEKIKAVKHMTEDEVTKLQKLGVNIHNVKFEPVTAAKKAEFAAGSDEALKTLDVGDTYFVSATITNNSSMGAIRLPMKNGSNEITWAKYMPKQEATYTTEDGSSTQTLVNPAEPAKFIDDDSEGSARLQADSVTIDEKSGALRVMTSDGTLYPSATFLLPRLRTPTV